MPGEQAHQFAGKTATDEAMRIGGSVVRHPIHVELNDIDREPQHDCRPDDDRDAEPDIHTLARRVVRAQAQAYHGPPLS